MGAPPRRNRSKFHHHVYNPPGRGTKRPEVVVDIAASRSGGKVAAAVLKKGDKGALARFLDQGREDHVG